MMRNNLDSGNITSLKHYRIPMKNPILVELLDHWEKLRAGRIAPMRSEIDPRQIENVLQYAFILERMNNSDIRFRIAGMQLCEIMGMEIRAMPATSIISTDGRQEFKTILNRLFDTPEIVELSLHSCPVTAINLSAGLSDGLKAEMLLLPMTNEDGETSRILGCLVPNGQRHSPPQRFEITGRKVTRIVAFKQNAPENLVTGLVDGFAENPDVFKPCDHSAGRAAPRRDKKNYLRLIKSDG